MTFDLSPESVPGTSSTSPSNDNSEASRHCSTKQDNRAESNESRGELPEYLPARMLNEFVYCPRLFFYEWVEGVFRHNQETVEGAIRHAKLDSAEDELPSASEIEQGNVTIHTRSITLSSESYRLIAKLDLVEATEGILVPVDYKRGSPRENPDGSLVAWEPDRVQLAVQALVLRENGYRCEEGIIYYVATKQRIRVAIDEPLVAQTLTALRDAMNLAKSGRIPPPLADSPKCPKCSLVSICLPDETLACLNHVALAESPRQQFLFETGSLHRAVSQVEIGPADDSVRRLVAARDDLRPLYLNSQGLYVGKSANVLRIKERDKVVQEVRINDICQLNLFGNIQLTTQAIQTLCENEIPICYFSMGGWFYGVTQSLGIKNIFLRREQFRFADISGFCLRVARALVAGKIRNQRTMLQRNHVEPPAEALARMKWLAEEAERATSLEQLLGIEGNGAKAYFENFSGLLKVVDGKACALNGEFNEHTSGRADTLFTFDFQRRNRRPPRDPVNALLSLAYSVLSKDLAIVCQAVGFDPYLGFYHQPRFGRPALALDLMEPFRPLIADSAVLSAINTGMVTANDFIKVGESVALTASGRKAFFRAYEQRMDTLVTHPLFGYRVNYRRMLEIQTRLLARMLTGEIGTYTVFTTR